MSNETPWIEGEEGEHQAKGHIGSKFSDLKTSFANTNYTIEVIHFKMSHSTIIQKIYKKGKEKYTSSCL